MPCAVVHDKLLFSIVPVNVCAPVECWPWCWQTRDEKAETNPIPMRRVNRQYTIAWPKPWGSGVRSPITPSSASRRAAT